MAIGIKPGVKNIEKLTYRLKPGNLIIIAGHTNQDEILLALNITQYIAEKQKFPTILFIPEMSNESMVKLMERVTKSPNVLRQSLGVSVQELCDKARFLKEKHKNLSLLVIDDLQYLLSDGRYKLRIPDVWKILKALACELNVPIIAGAPISREIDSPESDEVKSTHKKFFRSKADYVIYLSGDDSYENEDASERKD